MKIEQYEDSEVWSLSREFAKEIYNITRSGIIARDFSFRDQMRRSAVSIMANIAEGFERGGNKEFIQFLYIAKASCGELRSQLYRAFDRSYIEQKEFDQISTHAKKISSLIQKFIKYLENTETKGIKYKKSTGEEKKGHNL